MCWWGVVPVERVHRQQGPLGTHPCMCMGPRTRHPWGQANGHLDNPLESQHSAWFCAPIIVPATFRRCFGHLFEHPLEQFGSNNLPLFFEASSLVVDTKQVVYDARDHQPMFGWGKLPLGALHHWYFTSPTSWVPIQRGHLGL